MSSGRAEMDVDEVMTLDPPVCLPEDSLERAASLLGRVGIGCVPVIKDEASREVVGVLTRADVERARVEAGSRAAAPVARVMSDAPRTCWPEDSLEAALAVMRAYGVSRLPVVDVGARLLGVVSYADLLRGGVERD